MKAPWLATIAVLMSCSEALAVDATPAALKVDVLIVDSKDSIAKWVLGPPGKRQADHGRLRAVKTGTKVYLPVIVTGFDLSERHDFSADLQIVAPGGKTQALKRCCGANAFDPRTPGLVVLNPVVDITFDAEDVPGAYTVRATVSDGASSATTSERFRLQPDAAASTAPAQRSALPSAPDPDCVIKPVMTDEEIKRCR